jgi:site-specific DNA-methyltransferase (adenine-specific)
MKLEDNELDKILQGNALEVLKTLPRKSIDMVITSPPYWALRDYSEATETIWGGNNENCQHEWGKDIEIKQASSPKDWEKAKFDTNKSSFCKLCGAWRGQLGAEPHPQLFIEHLVQIFDELKKVLKDTGTIWVNLGDTYGTVSGGMEQLKKMGENTPQYGEVPYEFEGVSQEIKKGLQEKSLLQIPARFAIAMCERGWILRNTIIWHKPNAIPSSTVDRFTIDFEYLFFFAKKPRYFFNQQFEPYTEIDRRTELGMKNMEYGGKSELADEKVDGAGKRCGQGNPMGKNKRAVWEINTKPSPYAHWAVFPEKLIETPIDAGCPEFVCSRCGQPREKIWEIDRTNAEKQIFKETVNMPEGEYKKATGFTRTVSDIFDYCLGAERKMVGWRECSCREKWEPGIVLDPFMGSGTTAGLGNKSGLHRDSPQAN